MATVARLIMQMPQSFTLEVFFGGVKSLHIHIWKPRANFKRGYLDRIPLNRLSVVSGLSIISMILFYVHPGGNYTERFCYCYFGVTSCPLDDQRRTQSPLYRSLKMCSLVISYRMTPNLTHVTLKKHDFFFFYHRKSVIL